MAIDFPTSPTAGQVYSYNGVTYVYTAQGVWATAGASAVGIIGGSPQGRLTLQTAVPVMTTTQAAKTTIYYTPYVGNRVPIYDGTNMTMTTFTELSNVTTATSVNNAGPAAVAANSNYDLFVWSNAGTIRLTRGPAWTNDTTRSAGTALVMVNGIWLNNAAITNGPAASRGTYVGSTRSNASSQLDWIFGGIAAGGTAGFFSVWNAYNRVDVQTVTGDSADTWAVNSATFLSNAAGTRVSFVSGLAEDAFDAMYSAYVTAPFSYGNCAIGYDVTNAASGTTGYIPNGSEGTVIARYGTTALGFHFVAALDASPGGVTTFLGDGGTTQLQSGLHFRMKM